jgi:hypothetical protein
MRHRRLCRLPIGVVPFWVLPKALCSSGNHYEYKEPPSSPYTMDYVHSVELIRVRAVFS